MIVFLTSIQIALQIRFGLMMMGALLHRSVKSLKEISKNRMLKANPWECRETLQMYHWDSGLTNLVRQYFEAKLKVQMTRQSLIGKIQALKSRVVTAEQPVTLTLMDMDSKHRSSQTSFKAHARVIAEETRCSIPDLIGVFEITKQTPDGYFVQGKAEQLYNDVTSKFQELSQAASDDPESTGSGGLSPAEKNKIYCEFTSSGSEDQSLKKILNEQALVIQSHVSEIGKLNVVVCYLANKDSTVADILQSEDRPSQNSEGMSHDSGDDDESDAI
ncbi:hypothetical protein Bca4012_036764 [Brassica carinata]